MSLGLITPLPGEMTEDTQDAPAAAAARRSRPVSGSVGVSLFSPPPPLFRCVIFLFLLI